MPLPTFLLPLIQYLAIATPTLYAGITFQYSLALTHLANLTPKTHPKPLARHWLALYQLGPRWVPPLIFPGVLSNLFLAYHHHHRHQPSPETTQSPDLLYLLAALLTFSILPITFLYFEPGINGACKWKVETLLRDDEDGEQAEEFRLLPDQGKGKGVVGTSVKKHSAREGAKRWAEETGMGELVGAWVRRNNWRWVLGGLAGSVSFLALMRGGLGTC